MQPSVMKPFVVLLLCLALASTMPAPARAAALDTFIADYANSHRLSGSVLIQKDGRIAYRRSFGLASIEFGVPNGDRTHYWIASLTKLFTATLVLQLAEQGRLDLDAPIATYLPDYAGEGARKVSLHQLLNHTSGIDNFDQVKTFEDALKNGLPAYQTPYSVDQLVAKFCSGRLVHAPGSTFDYNNADYVLLGRIVERVYGKPFGDVLQERILAPLSLKDSGLLHRSDIVPGLAEPYLQRADLKRLSRDFPVYPENWFAAGAMYSTPDDVLAFANALFGRRLLHGDSLQRMLKPGLDDYGYGLWVYDTHAGAHAHRVAKRPGRIGGAQAMLYRFLDGDATVIVLANTDAVDLDAFVAEIGKRLVD